MENPANSSETDQRPCGPPADPSGTGEPSLFFGGLKALDSRHLFLRKTGFSPHTLAHFGVGYCEQGFHAGRIAVPIHDREGNLVACAGYCPETGRYVYPAGFQKERVLFNFHRALAAQQDWEEFILVADCLDVFRLYEAGCHACAALMGETLSDEQFGLLTDTFEAGSELTLFLPHGCPGTVPVAARLLDTFYLRILWPEGENRRPQDVPFWKLLALFRY
jgi:hypothetical protein